MKNIICGLLAAMALFASEAVAAREPPADVGAGRVAWFDISTGDLTRSKDFYAKLFDWEFTAVKGTNKALEIDPAGHPIGMYSRTPIPARAK